MATFGKTTDGTNVQTFSGDRIYISQGTPTSNGTVTAGFGRVRVTAASTSECRMVIYADNGGTPAGGAILAVSDEVIVNWTTSTLTEFPFSGTNQISITADTPYWIGFWFDDPGTPSFEMKRDNTTGLTHFAAEVYPGTGTPASPFVSGGTANGPLNAYIQYTEEAGAPVYLNTSWKSRVGAWVYPGEPACAADDEFSDGRRLHFINTEYFRVNGSGAITQLNDPTNGCNAYSVANAAKVKRHSAQRFITLAGDGGAGDTTLLAKTGSTRQADFDTMSTLILSAGFDGIDVDIEGFGTWTTTKRDNFYSWLTALSSDFHSKGLLVNVDCPPLWVDPADGSDWAFNILDDINVRYEDIEATGVDFMTIMLYDHQFDVGIDGGTHAVQPYGWIDEVDSYINANVTDVSKIIIGIPSYGYTAVEAAPYNITILTKEQVDAAIDLSLGTRDTGSDEMFYVTGTTHYVWSDTTTLNNKRQYLENLGYRRVCVWHLGGNDWFTAKTEAGRTSPLPGYRNTI